MPRDLSTLIARLRSPEVSTSWTTIQVSMREETPRSSSGFWVRLELRLVRRAVMPFDFKWSTSRVIIDRTSWGFPSAMKSVMGSMIATEGLKSRMARRLAARCISSPKSDGRAASMRRSPFFPYGARSPPMARKLRGGAAGAPLVAQELPGRPREAEDHAPFAALAGGEGQVCADAGLPGASRAG